MILNQKGKVVCIISCIMDHEYETNLPEVVEADI